LKYGEQSRVFRLIPALKNAEFLRLGSIHRNTYVCGPRVLRPDLSLKGFPGVYLAGQVTGVEGYLESAACGMLAALFITQRLEGKAHSAPPANTALGALLRHVTGSDPKNYQPGNMNFSLFDPNLFEGAANLKRDELRAKMATQAIGNFKGWLTQGERKWDATPALS
ncbi:MAG: FAD-dependent oxidoreductase, partial [Bdellovibrionota bacterium]